VNIVNIIDCDFDLGNVRFDVN